MSGRNLRFWVCTLLVAAFLVAPGVVHAAGGSLDPNGGTTETGGTLDSGGATGDSGNTLDPNG
jgi:hypothetical protein